MNEPDWAKLLDYLYKTPGELYVSEAAVDEESRSKEEYLQKILKEKIDFSDTVEGTAVFGHLLRDMEEIGLIDVSRNEDTIRLCITEKGFNIAHEREMQSDRQRINKTVAILTFVVAAGTIIQAYSAYLSHNYEQQLPLVATILVLMFVFPVLLLYLVEDRIPVIDSIAQRFTE